MICARRSSVASSVWRSWYKWISLQKISLQKRLMSSRSISCSGASLQIFLICGSYLFTIRFIFWNSPDVQVCEVHLTGMGWKGATNIFPQVGQMYVQDFPTFTGIRICIYYNIMSLFCFINNFIAHSWLHDNIVGTTLNNAN